MMYMLIRRNVNGHQGKHRMLEVYENYITTFIAAEQAATYRTQAVFFKGCLLEKGDIPKKRTFI